MAAATLTSLLTLASINSPKASTEAELPPAAAGAAGAAAMAAAAAAGTTPPAASRRTQTASSLCINCSIFARAAGGVGEAGTRSAKGARRATTREKGGRGEGVGDGMATGPRSRGRESVPHLHGSLALMNLL